MKSGRTIFVAFLALSGLASFGQSECSDGTTSTAQHRQGACSHHGGMATFSAGPDTAGHFATQQEIAALAHAQRDSHGRIKRSPHVRAEFEREHPCPVTGAASGSCPGYVIDHVIPLSCDGPDSPYNMQWQTVEAAREKDRWERTMCGK